MHITPPAGVLALALVCAALVGCDDYFDSEGLEHCNQQLASRYPEPGTQDAFAGGWLIVGLDCPATQPTLTLRRPGSGPYELTVQEAHGGRQLRVVPAVPLFPESTYNVELSSGDEHWGWLFTTDALGSPIEYPLAGHSEEFLLDQGQLLSPPGMEEILRDPLQEVRPVLQFLLEPGITSFAGRLGALMAQGNHQDSDWPTFDRNFPWDAPYFSLGPLDLNWNLPGWQLVLEAVMIRGTPHPVLGGMGAVTIHGLWDTRNADVALGGSSGSLCALAADGEGEGCIPCTDGSVSCLELVLLDVPTRNWPGDLSQTL